jgi:hypothetical protein
MVNRQYMKNCGHHPHITSCRIRTKGTLPEKLYFAAKSCPRASPAHRDFKKLPHTKTRSHREDHFVDVTKMVDTGKEADP